jgi:hypothetical protein
MTASAGGVIEIVTDREANRKARDAVTRRAVDVVSAVL